MIVSDVYDHAARLRSNSLPALQASPADFILLPHTTFKFLDGRFAPRAIILKSNATESCSAFIVRCGTESHVASRAF